MKVCDAFVVGSNPAGHLMTNETTVKIEEYIEKYPNLIKLIISYDNVGMNKNFIRTMKSCKGNFIAICEGDDYWTDPKKIQIQKDSNNNLYLYHPYLSNYLFPIVFY